MSAIDLAEATLVNGDNEYELICEAETRIQMHLSEGRALTLTQLGRLLKVVKAAKLINCATPRSTPQKPQL